MPAKGYQNKPGRSTGGQNANGVKVRNSIARHFAHLNDAPHDKKYLTVLSRDHPASYVALVSKVIPQQAQIEITAHAVDLGAAMLEASTRLAEFNALLTIDHQATETLPLVITQGNNTTDRIDNMTSTIDRDGTAEGGLAGGHPEDRGAAVDCGPDPDSS